MSTELDELLAPKPDTQETPPQDEDKVGKLANENADLRRRLDTLQSEMESFRKPAPPQMDDPDKWYTEYMARVKNEERLTDQEFLTDPLGAWERGTKRILKDSRGWMDQISTGHANSAANSINMSIRFSQRYPKIWRTRVGQEGLREAVGELIQDPRFQRLIGRPETLDDALDVVAKRVEKIIPELSGGKGRVTDDEIPEVRESKGTRALASGARPMGPREIDEDLQDRAGREMDDAMMSMSQGRQPKKR